MQTTHRVWKLVFEYENKNLTSDELIFSNLGAAQASFDAMCKAYENKIGFQRAEHYASWHESAADEDLTIAYLSYSWIIINNDPVLNWEGHDTQAKNFDDNGSYSIEFKY